jgi:hypothetical protein
MIERVTCYYASVTVTHDGHAPTPGLCRLTVYLHGTAAWASCSSTQARKIAALLIEEADRMDGLIPR